MRSDGTQPKILWVGGEEVPLAVRIHPRARHIALAVDGASGGVRLTLPPGTSVQAGLRFAAKHNTWLEAQLGKLPPQVPFAAGVSIPVLGESHVIEPAPQACRGVWKQDGKLFVSGRAEYLPRRVGDYLKREAKSVLGQRARQLATTIDRKVMQVAVRDMKSRWGSCSADGRLRFNWRLILAPEDVLDYVVAHEVAHLVHMDHSRRFWSLVESLCPDTRLARRWLANNGNSLMRYG